jgi:hypothetical protein
MKLQAVRWLSVLPLLALASLSAMLVGACDDKPSSGAAPSVSASSKASTASPSATLAPTAETKPVLSLVVDDKRFTINGDKVDFGSTDPKGQIASAISSKAGIQGEIVNVVVMRDTLTPKVAMVVSGLRSAKAQAANVKTQQRDGNTANLTLTWGVTRPECAAVGMIGKDSAITAWSVGGGTAARFARGFAGPDLTLGSAGVRKVIAGCESTVLYLSAADNITWGLTFDLALAVRNADDAGAPLRAANTTLLVDAPVPGRKVAQD